MWRFVVPAALAAICVQSMSGSLPVVAQAVGPTEVEEWPQWGGPRRDFTLADVGLADAWRDTGPREIWRRQLGDGYSGVVASGDKLFTLLRDGDSDVVVALSARDGGVVWRHAWIARAKGFMDLEFGPGPHSTPLISDGRVFAVGSTGRLVALDQDTGRQLWTRDLWDELGGTPLERGYAASPIAFEDLVILPVGGSGRAVVAFHQADGRVVWEAEDFDVAYSSPIMARLGDRSELIALLKTELVGLDPASGRRLWILPVSDHRYVNVDTPLLGPDGLVFFSSSEGGQVVHLAQEDGTTKPRRIWADKVIGSQIGNVVRVGEHLFGTRGSAASKYVTLVDLRTGELTWRSRELGDCSLLRVGDKTLALEDDGTLRLISPSPSGLKTISRAKILDGRSWTAPALVGTTLYARNRSEIVAVDLGR